MATTASRNKYSANAAAAARAERKGDYQTALYYWKAAAIYAPNSTESNWVAARIDFCEMRIEERVSA